MRAINTMTQTNSAAPIHLTCEYKIDPIGIETPHPRLSWRMDSSRRGAAQSAYQILVASDSQRLKDNQGDLWDSGQLQSDQSIHIPYGGKPLNSAQRAHWKVRIWDEAGRVSEYSKPAFWEMGLLNRKDWIAQWIGSPIVGGPKTTVPVPFLRKLFTLEKPIASARLYATALGVYEAHVNGRRVGQDIFSPGWTDYRKRVQYQAYDVTDFLHTGRNAIGALLGDGWYCSFIGNLSVRQFFGDRPKFFAQLVVKFTDGTAATIITDGSWKQAIGPIVESDFFMGESHDARREMPGWATADFDDSLWEPVLKFNDPGIAISASVGPPVRAIRELTPIADPKPRPGRRPGYVFDLGQNMVGRVRLKISGPAGANVVLRFAEMLNPDGTMYMDNLRTARQTDCYTLAGKGEEIWESRFTFHGFRYVELTGLPTMPPKDAITGIVLHSEMEQIGSFECSEPLINQLQKNIEWGQRGNFLDVPTDCPQRDERLGWTGDAQVFCRTAAFNFDVGGFFTKWVLDLRDAQGGNGTFPKYAPDSSLRDPKWEKSWGEDGGPAWADAGIICPWTIYLCQGDRQMLEDHYDSAKRYIEFLKRTNKDFLRCAPGTHRESSWDGFGDWLSIRAETPKELIGTAFFAYSAQLMSRIAKTLGKTADAEEFSALAEHVKRAFVHRYVTQEGLVVGHTQTAYLLALHFDLLPPDMRAAATDALVRDIRSRGNKLSTGFVGSPYLNHVLTDQGRLDVAYELLLQKDWPSWLYAVTQGATTIWERWDGWTHDKGFQDPAMNSFNHYAYGAIGDWLYRVVAGIEVDPDRPGYKHIIFNPHPGQGLTHARASLLSPYGKIRSDWKIQGERFNWTIEVPPNATGTAHLPTTDLSAVKGHEVTGHQDGRVLVRLTSGIHDFSLPRANA
jgi:alpha-L-rhamnosidase